MVNRRNRKVKQGKSKFVLVWGLYFEKEIMHIILNGINLVGHMHS